MATNDFVVKNGLDVTEAAVIRATTDSSTKDTGALIVEGGVGIEKNLNVGVNLGVGGTADITGNTTITGDLAVNGADITTTSTGTATLFNANATTLNIGQAATTVSLGATTGTTTVRNALTVGGAFTANSGAAAISPANANVVLSPTGTGVVTVNPATLGTINNMSVGASTRSTGAFTTLAANNAVTFTQNTGSTSTTSGTLIVTGGVGISERLYAGSLQNTPIGSVTANSGAFTSLTANAAVTLTQNTGSTSTTSGTLVVTGGVGISERLYAGSLQNTPIGSSVASSAAFTSLTANGAVTFTQNTASTTTSNGTLVVSGGIGVTGAINTGLTSTFAGFSSTSTTNISPSNATVTISPTGTGNVVIAPATLGSINNMSIGATTASSGAFTTLTASSSVTLSPANANVVLSPTGTGLVTINPATAGTINNMSIGATTATTGRFTTVTSTQATGTAPFTVASTTLVTNLNADLCDGFQATTANTASTIAVRDASGDVALRLVRSEFANESTISGAMAYRVNNTTDNYIRFCSDTAAIRTFLNVPTRTGGDASGTWSISISGNAVTANSATSATNTTYQTSFDDRVKAPSDDDAAKMRFGFTSLANNNTAPYADYLHMRSYTDSSGGNDNLIMFNKSSIGMRIWQQTFGSGTAYASFKDVAFTDGTGATGTWAINISGLAATATTANQLGGVAAASFPRTGSDNLGNWNFASNTAAADYTAAAIELRELNFGGAQADTPSVSPRLSFHWAGRVASQIGIENSGRIAILNNPGTGYEAFICAALTASSITETSSITYKENVNPIDSALDKVLQLMGVTYDRKDGSAKNEAGLIAEEVAKVLPNLVSEKEGKPEGIHYTKLTAYLIECIKELNAKIEKLEGKNV
jgi:hypothetical protein